METIVCATEFYSWSDNAVKYAFELAQLMRAKLILLHAAPASVLSAVAAGGLPDAYDTEEELPQLLEELKKKTTESTSGNGVTLQIKRMEHVSQAAVTALVQQEKAGLLIAGHGRTGETEGAFSEPGTTQSFLSAPCPVLIVPQNAVFKPLWKIVYATNLKREPAADCAFLLKLAHLFNAELMLLHVLVQDVAGARELAIEAMQQLYRKLPYRNISFYIEASESVEKGISNFVRANKADMLVLSSQPTKIWQHLQKNASPKVQHFHDFLPMLIRQQAVKKITLCRNNCA